MKVRDEKTLTVLKDKEPQAPKSSNKHRKCSSPRVLRAAAQRAESRRRPDTLTARPEADRDRRAPFLTKRCAVSKKHERIRAAHLGASQGSSAVPLQLRITHQGEQHPGGQGTSAKEQNHFVLMKVVNVQLELRDGALLFCRERVEFGCFRLRLPEHDGERLHDQSAQAVERDERGQMTVRKLLLKSFNHVIQWECNAV